MSKAQDAGRTRYLSLVARIIVAVGAICWVLYGQDWARLGQVFRQLNLWYFVLGLAGFAASQLVIASRWWLLLRAQGICLAAGATVRLHFLGLFYNNVMPGAVGGDLLKAWYVTKHTERRLAGALSVFVDRFIGSIGLVFMAGFIYTLFLHRSLGEPAQTPTSGTASWVGRRGDLILWVLIGIAAVLAVLLVQPHGRQRLTRVLERALHRCVGLLSEVKDAALVYCRKPLTVLWAMLLTFVAQSLVIVAFWLLGRNLGIGTGLTSYFFIFPVMWLVGALPISVAGLGVVEAGTAGLLTHLAGASQESALALVLCQRLIWVVASLPGAAVHMAGSHLPGELC